jgi:pilus assembly protein Flp/PilA
MEKLLRLIVAMHVRLDDAADAAKDRGATATEYAVLVAFIALAIIAAVTVFSNDLGAWFRSLGSRLSG